jgi:hypothetical protein
MRPRSRGAIRPGSHDASPPEGRGRRECRVRKLAPIASRAKNKKHTSDSHYRSSRCPAFPARWSYGLCRALPGDRALLSPSSARRMSVVANLTPASGRQDHTVLPYACRCFVLYTESVHRIPRPTSVTIAKRPSCGCGMRENATDLGKERSEIFSRAGLDR